jgi:hypothetical protein
MAFFAAAGTVITGKALIDPPDTQNLAPLAAR